MADSAMLNAHGSQKFCPKETLHAAGSEGVRGHSGNHADQNDWTEVRQQLHARQDNLAEREGACFWHRAFGFRIQSDQRLSGLPPCSPSDAADIRVHLPSQQKFALLEFVSRSPYRDDTGEPILTVRRTVDRGFCLQYSDGTCFYVNETGSEVFASWPDGLTLED